MHHLSATEFLDAEDLPLELADLLDSRKLVPDAYSLVQLLENVTEVVSALKRKNYGDMTKNDSDPHFSLHLHLFCFSICIL